MKCTASEVSRAFNRRCSCKCNYLHTYVVILNLFFYYLKLYDKFERMSKWWVDPTYAYSKLKHQITCTRGERKGDFRSVI